MILVPPAPRSPQLFSSIAVKVRHEIRLPHVIAGPHGDEVAVAGEIFLLSRAVGEIEIAAEHEIFVVKDIHHHRQVGGADDKRALGAAGVEVAVPGVERDGEQAFFAPLKTAATAVGEFELGRAMAFKHIDDFFVEMPLRRRRLARRDIEHEHIGEIAAALEVHRRAVDAVTRPRRGLDAEQIDAIVLGDAGCLHRQANRDKDRCRSAVRLGSVRLGSLWLAAFRGRSFVSSGPLARQS